MSSEKAALNPTFSEVSYRDFQSFFVMLKERNANSRGSPKHSLPTQFQCPPRIHLIPCELWQDMTGEPISQKDLCFLLETSMQISTKSSKKVVNNYLLMARDPQKSRILQQNIEDSTQSNRLEYFDALLPFIDELVYDSSGSYVLQKLFEYMTPNHEKEFLDYFINSLDKVIEQQCACRVLQKFLDTASIKTNEDIFEKLKPSLLSLCQDINGNHIIQCFVVNLRKHINEIIDQIRPDFLHLAKDRYGCSVIQKICEKYTVDEIQGIVEEVLKYAVELSKDQYGNYVVQNILSSKSQFARYVAKSLKGHFYDFSLHKYASNVIEKCIRRASDFEKQEIFAEIIGSPGCFEYDRILNLVQNQFGNYVIQRIIKYGTEEQQYAIYDVIDDHYDELINGQYAKYVISSLEANGLSF